MADSIFKIGTTAFKNPSGFKKSRYNITNLKRLADGSMGGQLIAKKQKFFFKYDFISAAELDNILDLVDTDELFFTLTYIENGVEDTAEVYVGEIPANLHWGDAANADTWVWKGVNFNLIER